MTEDSLHSRSEEVEILRKRVAELELQIEDERAQRQAAEQLPGTNDSRARGAGVERATQDARILAEIDKREQVELALEDSQALYHSLVEHLPISVYRIDMEGRIIFGNSAYLKDIGKPLAELVGKSVFDVFPEKEAQKYAADDQQVIKTNQVLHVIEEHYVRGRLLYVEVLKCPVHDHEGRLVGVQGSYWDVTARRQAEEQLKKTLSELERSNKELQQFAGVASHDMHAPLRRIVTLSDLLQKQYANEIDEKGREWFSFMVASAEHMQELIDVLLNHSRVGNSRTPLEPIDCLKVVSKAKSNLATLIDECAADIRVARLPTVMANTVELVQLFQNLIGNAIKYCGEATPRVEVSVESADDQWRFRIKDNGIGIAQEHREKVFEAFERLHGEDKYPGTGIGLATCKKIVERLDGRIWVEANENGGSVFAFTIPQRGLPESTRTK